MGQLPGWRWLSAATPGSAVLVRSNSFVSLVSNLKAGLGLGALPTILGDAEPELVRCLPPPPELKAEFWLIVREEIKGEPHVRAFTEFLASYVRGTCGSAAD
jgi:DNA-binding transcriptional LysR family regulator